jgi:3-dehydrosphinganine reductase
MNTSLSNRVVVITGGSSGIGLATAHTLLSKGATVCIVARNEKTLRDAVASLKQDLPDAQIHAYAGDVANNDAVQSIVRQIANDHGGIDWLINNAGIGDVGKFESQQLPVQHRVFDVNYWGAVHMTIAALPYLKLSKHPALVFVSSVAGYVGLYGYTHYTPSKFALTGLAECLRMEFNDYNIPVTVVYPPDTDTPMLARERETTLPECRALSAKAKVLSPATVANALVAGVLKKKFEVYCNGESKMIRVMRGLTPRIFFAFVDGIVRKDQSKRMKAAALDVH